MCVLLYKSVEYLVVQVACTAQKSVRNSTIYGFSIRPLLPHHPWPPGHGSGRTLVLGVLVHGSIKVYYSSNTYFIHCTCLCCVIDREKKGDIGPRLGRCFCVEMLNKLLINYQVVNKKTSGRPAHTCTSKCCTGLAIHTTAFRLCELSPLSNTPRYGRGALTRIAQALLLETAKDT